MSLKDVLFSFKGRIPRSTYWYYQLASIVIGGMLGGILGVIAGIAASTTSDSDTINAILLVTNCLVLIITLPLAYMGLAVSVKRAHDRDHSGWFVLIALIPFIGGLWILIELGFMEGTIGSNQYGPDPNQRLPFGSSYEM